MYCSCTLSWRIDKQEKQWGALENYILKLRILYMFRVLPQVPECEGGARERYVSTALGCTRAPENAK